VTLPLDRVPPRRAWAVAWFCVAVTVLGLTPAGVQSQGIWPERAENLQELPEDFPAENLQAVMRGFTRSLGVRCSYCHLGEEGQPLSTYDFVSDANPNKDRARAMLRMLGEINGHLREIEPSAEPRVNMWCHTCHAGKPRPMTLQETLTEAYAAGGGTMAMQRFLELRQEFYGGNQYDFRGAAVNGIADGFLQQGDTATALNFLERNVEHFPDWAQGHVSLGDVLLARGRADAAARRFARALELAPGNAAVEERLERAMGGG
jgi:tetratricopeptide (TPR) repeat protein